MSIPHRALLPPVTTPGDLTTRWTLVAREGDLTGHGRSRNDLLVQLFDADGHQQSALVVVEDVPDRPEGPFLRNLAAMLHEVLAEETAGIGVAAFALSPPAPRDVTAAGRGGAPGQVGAGPAEGFRVLGVHLVTDGGARPVL